MGHLRHFGSRLQLLQKYFILSGGKSGDPMSHIRSVNSQSLYLLFDVEIVGREGGISGTITETSKWENYLTTISG